MNTRWSEEEMAQFGFPAGEPARLALAVARRLAEAGSGKRRVKRELRRVLRDPRSRLHSPEFADLARCLVGDEPAPRQAPAGRLDPTELRDQPVPGEVWGRELLDGATLDQFEMARRLPVAVRAAQMPDGHIGYGLPIGGVLACRGAVIPYAVGVDIACRMRLSVYHDPLADLTGRRDRLRQALVRETRFGIGAAFDPAERREHAVMDDPAWAEQRVLRELRDKAAEQLGTSGSGNHFVEFGELVSDQGIDELELPAGRYLALLSHSGSRGLGARLAEHFTKVARSLRRLPSQAAALSWLELTEEAGQAYWQAMELAGRYAAANHELIHHHVAGAAGLTVGWTVENHHNFAWIESYDGEELVVHRKGATPAGRGVLGIIPGSMGDPGFVVRGLGHQAALNSSAHGAGRVMSRTRAKQVLTVNQREEYLRSRGIDLLAGGLDESPQVYKPIRQVMAAQRELVQPVAEFHPKLVLMAGGGRAED